MPRVIPKPRFADDELVVCWMAHSWGERTIPAGAVLRGSDPAVKANAGYFRRGDATTEEVPNPWTMAVERADSWVDEVKSPALIEHERQAVTDIPAEEACVALLDFEVGGRSFRPGRRYRRDDPIVRRFPHHFGSVSIPLSEGG